MKKIFLNKMGSKNSRVSQLEDKLCAICLEDKKDLNVALHVNRNETKSINHIFCKSCINDWFSRSGSKSCPLCRQDIESMENMEMSKNHKSIVLYNRIVIFNNYPVV